MSGVVRTSRAGTVAAVLTTRERVGAHRVEARERRLLLAARGHQRREARLVATGHLRTADADHVEECRTDILDAPLTIEGNESVRTERKDCIELSPYRLEIFQRTGKDEEQHEREQGHRRRSGKHPATMRHKGPEHLIDRLAHDEGHPEFGQALEAEDAIHVVDRRQLPIIP